MAVDKQIQDVIHTVVKEVVLDQAKENIQESMVHTTYANPDKDISQPGTPASRVRKRLNIVK